MRLSEFKEAINKEIQERPDLKEEILDLYELAMDEIDGGCSAMHEMELCMNSIEELKNGTNQ
jgi:hypothetical protein